MVGCERVEERVNYRGLIKREGDRDVIRERELVRVRNGEREKERVCGSRSAVKT